MLNTDFRPQLLTTLPEKIRLLETTGADACAILNFTPEMAHLSAYDFMDKVLKKQYKVKTLLIGYDHRFGHNREDSFEDYKRYGQTLGIEVIQASCYMMGQHTHISSSEIRRALQTGEVEKAAALLTYPYHLSGQVTGGYKVGRKIGFPTANIQPDDADKLIPEKGVYAVEVHYDNTRYPGMLNIGSRPTFDNGNHISIEVHLIGFEKDIYNERLDISFLKRIRGEQKFPSVNELIAQLKKDREEVISLFSAQRE